MTSEEHRKLLEIRKRSKTGQRLTPEEQKFCEKMFKKWPDEYSEMSEYIKRWSMQVMNPLADPDDA